MTSKINCDELLVKLAQSGETQAFGLLVSKYQRRLVRLMASFTYKSVSAECVVEETFVKAFHVLQDSPADSSFRIELFKVAICIAKRFSIVGVDSFIAKPGELEMTNTIEASPGLGQGGAHERGPDDLKITSAVLASISRLPFELKAALLLRELERFSYDEISSIFGCHVNTVRSRIFIAREFIAQSLAEALDP